MRTTTALPRSAALVVWYTAWAAGRASLDDARDHVVADDAAHDVVGLPGEEQPVPLILALGRLRSAGAAAATLALPVPGDPLGLGGPPAFNAEALEVGEAVVLPGAGTGLVPQAVGAGVVWQCLAAVGGPVPDVADADRQLRQALLGTANALADLDVARWRPEVADDLLDLRRPDDLPLPEHWEPRAVRLAALSARCRRIVALALADDGTTVTAAEARARREALEPLDHAARRGLVAACSVEAGR